MEFNEIAVSPTNDATQTRVAEAADFDAKLDVPPVQIVVEFDLSAS